MDCVFAVGTNWTVNINNYCFEHWWGFDEDQLKLNLIFQMNTNYMFQADSIRFDFFVIVIHLLFAFYSLYFNCSENLYRLLSVSFIMFVFTQSVSSSANQMKQTLKQYKKFRRKTNCDLCILYVLCYICWRDKHIHKQRGTYSYVHKNKYIHWR